MSQTFQAGDYLVFQLEAAFGLLRVLAVDEVDGARIWHLAAYGDFFPDVETAEASITKGRSLPVSIRHMALTDRAFESTQVARIANVDLDANDIQAVREWRNSSDRHVSDRSVRLLLGLR